MSVQGLDKDRAPSAALAKKMLDNIGGRWWNVYIGGPTSRGADWSPERVRDYVKHGIDRFMLTYAGRQHGGPLTSAQGRTDGLEAVRIAKGFGYSGHFPLCLDVEQRTFESAPSKTVEYVRAWCAAVRGAGVRPGVYANPGPLAAMARGNVGADFVWVASWVNHGPTPHDAHDIPRFPRELWSRRGARAWQYAGAFDNKSCQVLGVDVDINVADLGCLAKPPGQVHARPPRPTRLIHRGDRGDRVERVTKRLSRLRSRRTGAPYLDGPRRRFDRGAELALRAFQREHGLDVDGVYGPASGLALAAALKRQRRRSGGDKAGNSGGQNGAASGGKAGADKGDGPRGARGEAPRQHATLRELIEDVRRLDGR